MNNLTTFDYSKLLSADDLTNSRFQSLIQNLIELTQITEGSGAPTFQAVKHAWYFDTTTSKYYRNTDGGTTWAALN